MSKFTKVFKEKAIRLKAEGVHPNQIFTEAGVSIEDKQENYALKMINKWRSDNQIRKKLGSKAIILLKNIKKQESEKRNKIKFYKTLHQREKEKGS